MNDLLVTLELTITLPNSYAKTYFNYYFVVRLQKSNDTMDTREIAITSTTVSTTFEMEESEVKKLQMFKLELELYQWRLRIFDSLIEDTEISLISLKKAPSMKRNATWGEERFTFECKMLENDDVKGQVIKTLILLRIPDPYKVSMQMANKQEVVKKRELKEETKEVPPPSKVKSDKEVRIV